MKEPNQSDKPGEKNISKSASVSEKSKKTRLALGEDSFIPFNPGNDANRQGAQGREYENEEAMVWFLLIRNLSIPHLEDPLGEVSRGMKRITSTSAVMFILAQRGPPLDQTNRT